jgi:hypothetical protein
VGYAARLASAQPSNHQRNKVEQSGQRGSKCYCQRTVTKALQRGTSMVKHQVKEFREDKGVMLKVGWRLWQAK